MSYWQWGEKGMREKFPILIFRSKKLRLETAWLLFTISFIPVQRLTFSNYIPTSEASDQKKNLLNLFFHFFFLKFLFLTWKLQNHNLSDFLKLQIKRLFSGVLKKFRRRSSVETKNSGQCTPKIWSQYFKIGDNGLKLS